MLVFKRNPVEIAAAVNTVLVALGLIFGWDPAVTGCLVAAVTAAATVVQYLNVFGTDQFTAAAVGFVSTVLTLLVAFQVDILTDSVQTALLAIVPTVLGLFSRNGVTNKHSPAGAALMAEQDADGTWAVDTSDHGVNVTGTVTTGDGRTFVGVIPSDLSYDGKHERPAPALSKLVGFVTGKPVDLVVDVPEDGEPPAAAGVRA